MKELGYTQENVADAMGINPSSLNRKINDSTGKQMSLADARNIGRILTIGNMLDYFFCE
jgi:transcriptional regulator with XRE-family HTH domain